MLYIKPHFYDEFSCIADKCPDTCCAGWQIVIDEESLYKYSQVKGGFGNRLCQSIDWEEGTFLQFDGRCSCLNDENLCDLYQELGPETLCETCRKYPRHVEEFDGVREFSLSLSCPEAARMILQCQETVRFLTWETEEEEPEPDEEFDFLLFFRLQDMREEMFRVIQNREITMEERMARCLEMGRVFQEALEEGTLFEIDEKIQQIEEKGSGMAVSFEQRKAYFCKLEELEVLREGWDTYLKEAERALFSGGEDAWKQISGRFWFEKWEQYAEQLMMFFVYTYFCGAVYDGMAQSKVMFAVYSTEIILELGKAKWLENGGSLTEEEMARIAWRYARETEHSDQNLEELEKYFQACRNETVI